MTTRKILLTQKVTLILVFMSLIVSLAYGSAIPNSQQTSDMTPTSIEDLDIDFILNQTSIGRRNGLLANLTLTNSGTNPVSNVKVNFTLEGEFAEFSSKYNSYQEVSLMTLGNVTKLNVEVQLNETHADAESAADVVLLFDASGSMGNEIDSVKAEFTDVVNRLTNTINSLRLGMVVYGWNEYSQYPASSVHNYIELTTDHQDVLDLIDELYAGGGTEPWGDAFALIDGWDWREEVPKLAIIIGDEDCDPGNIVGVGVTESYYNGTQLLNAITALKEKNIKINSVITDVADNQIVNQFHWIAEFTGGECVYLNELISGENPISLPQLIESWTLELVKEYYVTLNVKIDWTENTGGGDEDYSTELSEQIIIDLAGPSITVSTISNHISGSEYELEIYATPKDISGIAQINLYYTYDSLEAPFDPTWHFRILTDNISSTYYTTLDNLEEGDLVSFYVEATDNLGNAGKTVIFNITIAQTPYQLGSIIEFLFTEDDSIKNMAFNYSSSYDYFSNYADSSIGYLWIESDQPLDISFDASYFEVTSLFTGPNNQIYKVNRTSLTNQFKVIIGGNISSSAIQIKWSLSNEIGSFDLFEYVRPVLSELSRTILFHTSVSITGGSGYFTLIPYDPELVATVTIYEDDWTRVGEITTYENIQLDNGVYYFWVEQVVREGAFSLYFGAEEVTNGDPYYREYNSGGQASLPYLIPVIVVIGFFVIIRKRKKAKKGAN